MKKPLLLFLIFTIVLMTGNSCSHKAACGNTKKAVKSKTKSLKKNKHFNMM